MIKATAQLLQYLQQDSQPLREIVSSLVSLISAKGGPADAEAVWNYLLRHQQEPRTNDLYEVLLSCGTATIAEMCFREAVENGQLKERYDTELLEVFGAFQLAAARPMLVEYALGEAGYYHNYHAVRGLLHYDCSDLQDRIRTALEGVFNKSLFNEMMPALVCKLHDRKEVLEKLFFTGNDYCSSDCNGGIFLGFSLCGEEGLPYFERALFNPFWEAHYPPRHFVVEGMANLKLTFSKLFQEIRAFEALKDREYGLRVLLSLLEVVIEADNLRHRGSESYADLMREFFTLRNGNYSGDLIDFAEEFNKAEEAGRLETLLGLRLREETLFKCL